VKYSEKCLPTALSSDLHPPHPPTESGDMGNDVGASHIPQGASQDVTMGNYLAYFRHFYYCLIHDLIIDILIDNAAFGPQRLSGLREDVTLNNPDVTIGNYLAYFRHFYYFVSYMI
jgi:hypothetical protein